MQSGDFSYVGGLDSRSSGYAVDWCDLRANQVEIIYIVQ